MIREMMVGFALILLLIIGNILYQNIHCGTPVCRANPLQIIPCESAEKLAAEMEELRRMARERPDR